MVETIGRKENAVVTQQEISALAGRFRACQRTMTAMGDPVRQHLILVMM